MRSNSPLNTLLGYSLFPAAVAQGLLLPHVRGVAGLLLIIALCIPWMVVFLLNFNNRPMFPPAITFRFWLWFSILHAFVTLLVLMLIWLGYLHRRADEEENIFLAALLVMQIGWLSFIPPLRYFFGRRSIS